LDKGIKPVVWTLRATKDLERITRFYVDLYGPFKARQIATELRESTEILDCEDMDTSKLGMVDEAFNHLKRTYRKLIKHHCKITYREGKTQIFVVRVF